MFSNVHRDISCIIITTGHPTNITHPADRHDIVLGVVLATWRSQPTDKLFPSSIFAHVDNVARAAARLGALGVGRPAPAPAASGRAR